MNTVADFLRAPEMFTFELSYQDQELILEGLLGLSSIENLKYPERPLSSIDIAKIYECFQRLATGEPLPYIIGYTYFDGLKISVNPQVLIPRPDSETVIHTVIDAVDLSECSLLDLCTGSGAIGLALKHRRPNWQILATDISTGALEIAKKNAVALDLQINYERADLFEGLGQFDVIAANPPYIGNIDSDLSGSVRDFEPALALFSGEEGLDHITRIIEAAPMHLTENGLLCLEHGHTQGEAVRNIGLDRFWLDVRTNKDLSGNDRVTRMRVNNDR